MKLNNPPTKYGEQLYEDLTNKGRAGLITQAQFQQIMEAWFKHEGEDDEPQEAQNFE